MLISSCYLHRYTAYSTRAWQKYHILASGYQVKEKHMSHLSIRGIFRWGHAKIISFLAYNMRNKTKFMSKIFIYVLMTTPMMLKSLKKSSVGLPDYIWIYVGSFRGFKIIIRWHMSLRVAIFFSQLFLHLNVCLFRPSI